MNLVYPFRGSIFYYFSPVTVKISTYGKDRSKLNSIKTNISSFCTYFMVGKVVHYPLKQLCLPKLLMKSSTSISVLTTTVPSLPWVYPFRLLYLNRSYIKIRKNTCFFICLYLYIYMCIIYTYYTYNVYLYI